MSKLKLIQGDSVVSAVTRKVEIKRLLETIFANEAPTPRDRIIYAYHFACSGHLAAASEQLNFVPNSYFSSGIFRDLYRAVLGEIRAQQNPTDSTVSRQFEFFVVVKRATVLFKDLNFSSKPYFLEFSDEFKLYSTFVE